MLQYSMSPARANAVLSGYSATDLLNISRQPTCQECEFTYEVTKVDMELLRRAHRQLAKVDKVAQYLGLSTVLYTVHISSPHQSRVRFPHASPLLLVAEEVGFLVGSNRLSPPDGRLLVLSRGDAERADRRATSG